MRENKSNLQEDEFWRFDHGVHKLCQSGLLTHLAIQGCCCCAGFLEVWDFFVISQPMCTQAEALGVPWLTTVSKWYADGAVTALGGAYTLET
jgi:hypothetical protein